MNKFDLIDFKKAKKEVLDYPNYYGGEERIRIRGVVKTGKDTFHKFKENRQEKYKKYKDVKNFLMKTNTFSSENFLTTVKTGFIRQYELRFYKTDEKVNRIAESENWWNCGAYHVYGIYDKDETNTYRISEPIRQFLLDRPWLKEKMSRSDENIILIEVKTGHDAVLLAETMEQIAIMQYDIEIKVNYYDGDDIRAYYYCPAQWIKKGVEKYKAEEIKLARKFGEVC